MSHATTAPQGIDVRAIADAIIPGRIIFDPLGFVSGYKTYLIYTALAAKSEAELLAMGLKRTDLPGAVAKVVNEARKV